MNSSKRRSDTRDDSYDFDKINKKICKLKRQQQELGLRIAKREVCMKHYKDEMNRIGDTDKERYEQSRYKFNVQCEMIDELKTTDVKIGLRLHKANAKKEKIRYTIHNSSVTEMNESFNDPIVADDITRLADKIRRHEEKMLKQYKRQEKLRVGFEYLEGLKAKVLDEGNQRREFKSQSKEYKRLKRQKKVAEKFYEESQLKYHMMTLKLKPLKEELKEELRVLETRQLLNSDCLQDTSFSDVD